MFIYFYFIIVIITFIVFFKKILHSDINVGSIAGQASGVGNEVKVSKIDKFYISLSVFFVLSSLFFLSLGGFSG